MRHAFTSTRSTVGWVLSVVLLVGCWFGSTPAGGADAAPAPRLLVIGDSIILGTQGNIAANLPGWDVTFDAAVSRSTAAGLDALRVHGTDYQVVVVALGANDGGTPGVFGPRVGAMLDALGSVPHVVWLTIHEARPYYAQTNAIIREQVAAHPNAVVADWNAAIRPGDVGDDGLHLTPQGSLGMAAWVAGVVRLVSLPPPTTTTTTTTSTTMASTTMTSTTATHRPGATTTRGSSSSISPSIDARSGTSSAPRRSSGPPAGMWWGLAGILAVLIAGTVWKVSRRR